MGALEDNPEVLSKGDGAGEWGLGRAATHGPGARLKIKIKSKELMRGRTFLNKFVLIDEAQNLTPKQMKTWVTPAPARRHQDRLPGQPRADRHALPHRGQLGLTYGQHLLKGWPHRAT